ncbi:hypothetical protein FBQ82_14985 [Anaerolineae bacterium CFX7]|nr:hypothetical protein [Anaerolineae bacterium CFX7]
MKIPMRVFSFLLLSAGILSAMLLSTQSAYLAPLFAQGETDSFRYSAQVEGADNLYVNVSIDFDNANALRKYRQANQQRGKQLHQQDMRDIPVQITFKQPLAQPEAHALAEQAGLTVQDFTMVGHSAITKQRGGHFTLGSLNDPVQVEQNMGGNQERLLLEGVMVIKGTVANAAGLRQLEGDERIYLVDTSEAQVRELLNKHHRAWVKNKSIVVAVPSPFWMLDW